MCRALLISTLILVFPRAKYTPATIALALEGRFEDYTVGRDITLERVQEITAIADKHGFRMSGFRSFEREVTDEQIETVRKNARMGVRARRG